MKKQKKKNTSITPQFVKDARGKTTDVYLSHDDYQEIKKRLAQYKKLKKERGVKWITVSKEKK